MMMDIEVARYALRTFRLFYGDKYEKMETITSYASYAGPSVWFTSDWAKGDTPQAWTSVSICGGGRWAGGVCEAECLPVGPTGGGWGMPRLKASHPTPCEDCHCGIYGTLDLVHLTSQYHMYTEKIVAVIAAEGHTIIGDRGLRTERARVVAYWCRPEYVEMTQRQFVDAQYYNDIVEMQQAFGFPVEEMFSAQDFMTYTAIGTASGTWTVTVTPPAPKKEDTEKDKEENPPKPALGWSVGAQKQQNESKKALLKKIIEKKRKKPGE